MPKSVSTFFTNVVSGGPLLVRKFVSAYYSSYYVYIATDLINPNS